MSNRMNLSEKLREPVQLAPLPSGSRVLTENKQAETSGLEESFRRIFQNDLNCARLAEAAARGR